MPRRHEAKRLTLAKPRPVTVAQTEITKMLAEIPDIRTDRRRRFTRQEDLLILAAWGKKPMHRIAEYLGTAVETLKRRHRELTGGGG